MRSPDKTGGPEPIKIERWSALSCVLIGFGLFFAPYLWRADLFYDDVAHHVFWLYRYADSALFVDDITVPYFQTSAPWGYRALYASVAPFADVMQAAEWIAFGLFAICAVMVWRIVVIAPNSAPEMHGLFAVAALTMLLPLSAQQDFMPTVAFQRTFALPLVLMTIWGLVARRYTWVGISWLLAALLYPVVLPVQGLTAAVVFMLDLLRTRGMPPHWRINAVLGVAALTIAAIGIPVPDEVGPAFTYEEAILMREFGPDGRLVLYQDGAIGNWLRGHRTGLGWTPGVLLMIGLGVALTSRLGRARDIPLPVWALALTGVGLWAAMRLFPNILMFGLYLPNRHSRWAIGVFGLIAMSAGAAAVVNRLRRRVAESGGAGRMPTPSRAAVAITTPVIVAAVMLPHAMQLWQRPVDRDLENTYAYIATLPKSTLVAAHPDLADYVPIRAQRSVLTSTETAMAWMAGYYSRVKPRVESSLRAAYATRIEDVDSELCPYGVDVMLTGPSVWAKSTYFAPFDQLVQTLLESGSREGFVLRSPPKGRVLFRSGNYYVIRVEPCTEGK